MAQVMVCPLCSESLDEEGAHFYKHFKYKRFACGTNNCELQFYTESDRESHCTTHNHKRSFQKTVNPYIDKMIEMVVRDAHELATKDMDTVMEQRFGREGQRIRQIRIPTSSKESTSTTVGKKRSTVTATPSGATSGASSTTAPATKKSRTSGGASGATTASKGRGDTSGASTPAAAPAPAGTPSAIPAPAPVNRARTSSNNRVAPTSTSSSSSTTSASSSTTTPRRPPPPPPASASEVVFINSSSEVDSTTSDLNIPPVTTTTVIVEKPPPRQKRNKKSSETSSSSSVGAGIQQNRSYETLSAIEKITGFYDPNAPGLKDAPKIKCELCKLEIPYDFIVRIEHTSSRHMPADVAEDDYEDMLKTEMNRCYPDLPNSKLACQLCMNDRKVEKGLRFDHVQQFHHPSLDLVEEDLSALRCPVDECGIAFIKQKELSNHMKEAHQIKEIMSKYKDREFQAKRIRRNKAIGLIELRCFPWSQFEKIEKRTTSTDALSSTTSMGIISSDLSKDVRLKEASRTRRAAQYNESSSSDDDDSDAEDESSTTTINAAEPSKETSYISGIDAELRDTDIIVISQKLNADVRERLRQKTAMRGGDNTMMKMIKQEVPEEEEEVKEEPPEENNTVEEEENPSLSPRYAIPMVLSSYEPIVPPPARSPDPVVPAPPSLFAPLHRNYHHSSSDNNNGSSTEQPIKESPSSTPSPYSISPPQYRNNNNNYRSSSNERPRVTYSEIRGPTSSSDFRRRPEGPSTYSNHHQNLHRPYSTTQRYTPNSSYHRGNSNSNNSTRRYGSTAYGNRGYDNSSGGGGASRHHRAFQNSSSSSSSSRPSTSNSSHHRFFNDNDSSSNRDNRSSRY